MDRELFLKRKEMAQTRTFNLQGGERCFVKYLLSRLIECGHCGQNFVGTRQLKRNGANGGAYDLFRYVCNGYQNMGKSVCPSLYIEREWLEGHVLGVVREEICAPERLARLEDLVREKIEARRRTYGQSPKAVEQKIAALERKIQNYYDAIGEGLDAAVCRQKIAELEAERSKLEAEGEILRKEDYYVRALEKNLAGVREFAAAFRESFATLPFPVQRQVILHFVEKLRVLDRTCVELTLRVPFDNNGVQLLTDESRQEDARELVTGGNRAGRSTLQSETVWLPRQVPLRTAVARGGTL